MGLKMNGYRLDRSMEVHDEAEGLTLEVHGHHPMDDLLRTDRLPHIWCPGCGLGTALTCFLSALRRSELDLDKVSVVSGIGCTGQIGRAHV